MKRGRRDTGPRSKRGRAPRGSGAKAQKGEPSPAVTAPASIRHAAERSDAALCRYPQLSYGCRWWTLPTRCRPSTCCCWVCRSTPAPAFAPGARFGPRAVRDASSLARRFSSALGIDIYEELRVADAGDLPLTPHDIDQALDLISARSRRLPVRA